MLHYKHERYKLQKAWFHHRRAKVVIVVIAILAAIAIVSYQFVTNDARDSVRRQNVTQLAKSIKILMTKKDVVYIADGSSTLPVGGDGLCRDGDGGGWTYYPAYNACDMGRMLMANNFVTADFFQSMPPNEEYSQSVLGATMLYDCRARDSLILYYYLKNPTTEETANYDSIIQSCDHSWIPDYKMKAAIEIKR